jgi:hypothetical protein
MSKPFYRYEDVPLLIASEGQEPVMIFANRAGLSASQPIQAKKFVDDYNISFALQDEDIYFSGAHESGFLMGPVGGPGVKIPESIENILSGSRISYPGGQSLYTTKDLHPGDYHINVRSTGETLLKFDRDIEYGEVEVLRSYAAGGIVRGSLDITYYMNTGNLHTFADLTGLLDPNVYPQVDESKITGSFGDYIFEDAYLRELSFSAQPFEIIEANLSLDIYGRMIYQSGLSESITNNYGCIKETQLTVPHAINTKIEGSNDVGINYPLSFDYRISSRRTPEVPIPLSGKMDQDGELPTRVTKEDIDISIRIQGEKLDPFLKISGQRANVVVKLSDIGFSKDFTDNNQGLLKEFNLDGSLVHPELPSQELKDYGVVEEDNLTVSEGGFLQGTATIKQSYR